MNGKIAKRIRRQSKALADINGLPDIKYVTDERGTRFLGSSKRSLNQQIKEEYKASRK